MGMPKRNLVKLIPDIRAMQRFLLANSKQEGQCWVWTVGKSTNGYGTLSIRRKPFPAHRIAAFVFLGPPKNRLALALHKCRNKLCINPSHLYWGTYQDNINDAVVAGTHPGSKKVKCKRGHLLRGQNVHIRIGRTGMAWRDCLSCIRLRRRKRTLMERRNRALSRL